MDQDVMFEIDGYVDINETSKLKEILGAEYSHYPDFEFYDALLEYNNIEPKTEYLTLLKHFYSPIDLKFKINKGAIISSETLISEQDKVKTKTFEKIRLHMEKNNFKVQNNQTLNEIYNYIKEEFERLDLNIEAVNFLFNLSDTSLYNKKRYDYSVIKYSKIVMIYLFKSFYDSGKFKKIVDNLRSIKKKIFVLKFEEFDIDFNLNNNEYICGVFDLYKHKEDSYDGYELRRLFKMLENEDIYFRYVSIN